MPQPEGVSLDTQLLDQIDSATIAIREQRQPQNQKQTSSDISTRSRQRPDISERKSRDVTTKPIDLGETQNIIESEILKQFLKNFD